METLSKTVLLSECSAIGCNILVYDNNDEALTLIKSIAADGNIIVPKKEAINIINLIQNADLNATDICAIFLTEEEDEEGHTGFDIAKKIHETRSNIPIFMRLRPGRSVINLQTDERRLIAGCYCTSDPQQLKDYTNKFLYGFYFPTKLIDIFTSAGLEVLTSAVKGCEVQEAKPFLVYDHFINTEYTSILPVQFSFGNGILTLLIKEEDSLALVKNGHTALNCDQTSNDHLNQLISEVMNLFWGKVRLSCEMTYGSAHERAPVNIPIVVNHKKNYINFGNNTPQLCFRYVLLRDASVLDPIIVEFKMMFNSVLRPKDFPEVTPSTELKDDDFFEFF